MEIGFAGFLFFVRGVEWKKKREKMRAGIYWPVKPEWRLLTGGGLWCWYEKICGERLLAGWRRAGGSWDRKVWCSVKNRPERCRPAVGERQLPAGAKCMVRLSCLQVLAEKQNVVL